MEERTLERSASASNRCEGDPRVGLTLAALGLCVTTVATSAQTTADSTWTGGYDQASGFFMEDAGGTFRIVFGAYAQFRYSMNWRRNLPDSVASFDRGYSLNRTEIFFHGRYTDKLDYHFRTVIDRTGRLSIVIASFQWNFAKNWNLTVGEQFVPLSREDWQFAQDLLAEDYSANANTFALGTTLGFVAQSVPSNRVRYWLSISNGVFSARSQFPDPDESEVLFGTRFEFQLAGSDWSVWDDLIGRRGRPFGVMVGIAPAYLVRRSDTTDLKDEAQLNVDFNINGNGYQVMVAGSWTARNPNAGDLFSNYGLYVQGGYFLTPNWQVYARYDFVSPGDQPGDLQAFNDPGAGINYLPFEKTNRWKISVEYNYLFSTLNNTIVAPSGSLGWLESDGRGQTLLRFQAQFGF